MKIRRIKVCLAWLLSMAIVFGFLPGMNGYQVKIAKAGTNSKVINLGTSVIEGPVSTNADGNYTSWVGDSLYLGYFEGNPIRWQILAPNTTDFGGTTMLLHTYGDLFYGRYNSTLNNDWETSDIKEYLNSEGSFTTSGF